MIVGDVMKTDVVVVAPDMPWRDAAALLYARHVSCAPVVERGNVVGVLSEKDLFRGLFPSFREWIKAPEAYLDFEHLETANEAAVKRVRDVMSTKIISARPDTPVLRIGALMATTGIHHVPVVDDTGLVGVVGRGDIYRAILKKYCQIGM